MTEEQVAKRLKEIATKATSGDHLIRMVDDLADELDPPPKMDLPCIMRRNDDGQMHLCKFSENPDYWEQAGPVIKLGPGSFVVFDNEGIKETLIDEPGRYQIIKLPE